ncbi:ABC transporter substrate-binding protein [Burkholderia pseudomallei]|uniref:ABC transporter substrate-binding protein n=1 Tax=Burkholderia pseudomallei TaxID=28450 RepID=UPI002116789F|nr:ABC transporter substrate-binding protein [Burkholderia pseudomallei]
MTRPVYGSRQVPHVVFLNPGEAVERGTGQHWQLTARFMAIAAEALGMQLEVLYAERDHLLMLRQAEGIAQRADPPDYVVIVNEKMTAQQILTSLARSSTKVMLVHNDLTPVQRSVMGNEREQIPNWIGTLTADATRGGYRLMAYLCSKLDQPVAQVIGITGDPRTPVSLERAEGAEEYLARTPQGRSCQLVFGNWSRADGEQKARVLLARYPYANIIWAANDSMTLGALDAVRADNAPVLVGGMGALQEALANVANGYLEAMVAGDYFIGAWAMVLLHDYHCGIDFAASGGARQRLDFLRVIDRGNAARYEQIVFGRPDRLDFSQYSKVVRPRSGPYNFNIRDLLSAAEKAA